MLTKRELAAERRLQLECQAGDAIRKYLPYGLFVNAENGKVLFFNREYEVMEWAGQREFDIDPYALGITYTYVVDNRCLMPDDGSVYVGKMLFLYTEEVPYYFKKKYMITYFLKVSKVMEHVTRCLGNAFYGDNSTDKQHKELKRLRKKYFNKFNTKIYEI